MIKEEKIEISDVNDAQKNSEKSKKIKDFTIKNDIKENELKLWIKTDSEKVIDKKMLLKYQLQDVQKY